MNLKIFTKIKKHHILLGLVLGLTVILLPLHWAGAGIGTIIINATKFIVFAAMASILVVAIPISLGFLKLSEIILTWSVDPELFGNVTDSEFVMTAWGMVRDFSNMFFVLIFVAIGIATALRIKEYEIKKTLPRLLGVAVLINFSPVICGLVIDAANIFMNFFLTAGATGFNDAISLSSTAGDKFLTTMTSAWGSWSQFYNGVFFFRLLGVLLFNIFGAIVLLLFAMLFLVRNIAIWLLVILSPLAFFSYILPATKKIIFDKWRKEFVKWSFVGVTGAFFIYLSQLMLSVQIGRIKGPPTETMEMGDSGLSALIVSTIPILFLLIGFFVTLSTSAAGAKSVISLAKKGAGYINPATKKGRNTLGRLGRTAERAIEKGVPGSKDRAGKILAKTPESRQQDWKDAGVIKKTGMAISRTVMPYWARERVATKFLEGTEEGRLAKVKKEKKKTDEIETPSVLRGKLKQAKQTHNVEKQIAVMQTAAEKGLMDQFSEEEIEDAIQKAGKINKKLAQRIMQVAPNVAQKLYEEGEQKLSDNRKEWTNANAKDKKGKMKKLDKQFHEKKQELENSGLSMDKDDKDRYGTLEGKILLTMKANDIEKLSKDYVINKNKDPNNKFMEIVQDTKHQGRSAWSGNKLAKMADKFETPAVEAYNRVTEKQGEKWFNDNNPASKWIKNSPGAYAAGYKQPK